MMMHSASTLKKMFAASGLVFGLAGFTMFGGIGPAVAGPDTGSQDEMVEVHEDDFVTGIVDSDATQGDWDDDGYQADNVVASTPWVPVSVTGH